MIPLKVKHIKLSILKTQINQNYRSSSLNQKVRYEAGCQENDADDEAVETFAICKVSS